MKRRKEIICLFIVCAVLLISVTGRSSQNSISETEEQLTAQQIIEEIQMFDPSFSWNGELVSAVKNASGIDGVSVNSSNSIGTDHMDMYLIVSGIEEEGKDVFEINVIAKWLKKPAIRMQDYIALCWQGEFALIDSDTVTSYQGDILTGKTSILSMEPNEGIGYAVECSDYYFRPLEWVRLTAKICEFDRTGEAYISAAYCHQDLLTGVKGIIPGYGDIAKTAECRTKFRY